MTPPRTWAPYVVGRIIGPLTGHRLFGYPSTCPAHPGELAHFTTRAVESATGVALEIEVCTHCGRVKRVQAQ